MRMAQLSFPYSGSEIIHDINIHNLKKNLGVINAQHQILLYKVY